MVGGLTMRYILIFFLVFSLIALPQNVDNLYCARKRKNSHSATKKQRKKMSSKAYIGKLKRDKKRIEKKREKTH
jgi:hypothetical protein